MEDNNRLTIVDVMELDDSPKNGKRGIVVLLEKEEEEEKKNQEIQEIQVYFPACYKLPSFTAEAQANFEFTYERSNLSYDEARDYAKKGIEKFLHK